MALQILNESLDKNPSAFTEQFSRLGLAMHLSNLMESLLPPGDDNETDQPTVSKKSDEDTSPSREETDGGGEKVSEATAQGTKTVVSDINLQWNLAIPSL